MEAPRISEGLLYYLEQEFPDRIPKSPENISEKIGEQNVVRHLRHIHMEQNPLTETPDG